MSYDSISLNEHVSSVFLREAIALQPEETTPTPTCIEPSSLRTTHGVPIIIAERNSMTPVQSYRTPVLAGASSRQSLREVASSQPDCSDETTLLYI